MNPRREAPACSRVARRALGRWLAAVAVPLLAGCGLLDGGGGTRLDTERVEERIDAALSGRAAGSKVDDASCPAEVEVEVGATFVCTVTYDGARVEVVVTMVDDEGRVDIDLPE